MTKQSTPLFPLLLASLLFAACAKMGQPDGGWYDEEPPRILGASPADKATDVKTQKMAIYFDEFIKLNNPTENVIVSPPQLEMPDIKGAGKKILIHLLDSLKPNTTYTIDFSDAITDNNEDNPLGNFTYSFSTGDHIDTLEVSGHVLEAENLEPVKGIQVGLYSNLSDTAFTTEPMLRTSRTDDRGHFVIKGIAPGEYRIFALQDADGNYMLSQRGEKLAFSHDIIVPTSKPDVRHDTIWRDSLRIDSLIRVPYTHYLPDDIVLRAFTQEQTDRLFLKSERKQANRFELFFTYGDSILPTIRGLNFDDRDAFVVEHSQRRDTITYWIRDSLLINQDTLTVELSYYATPQFDDEDESLALLDSLSSLLTPRSSLPDSLSPLPDSLSSLPAPHSPLLENANLLVTDTLTLLSKEPYERRMKQQEKEYSDWKKKQEKAKKKGQPYDSIMPVKPLEVQMKIPSPMAPDLNPTFTMPTPIEQPDTSMIHLFVKHDTLWYEAPYVWREKAGANRTFELVAEWRPEREYSLEIDSAAFRDIYGVASLPVKQGFKVASDDEFSTLFIDIARLQDSALVVQLLDGQDKPVRQTVAQNGTAEFYYIKPGTYYMRLFIDRNGNGLWDTGDYETDLQPETVYYYPDAIECKEKWDLTLNWDPLLRDVARQKPDAITQQKGEKAKTIKRRNYERAKRLGIEYVRSQAPGIGM